MANEQEFVISVVSFKEPVNIGQMGMTEWLAADHMHANVARGYSTVEDKGQRLEFMYRAATITQKIDVPISNVKQVTRIPVKKMEQKK